MLLQLDEGKKSTSMHFIMCREMLSLIPSTQGEREDSHWHMVTTPPTLHPNLLSALVGLCISSPRSWCDCSERSPSDQGLTASASTPSLHTAAHPSSLLLFGDWMHVIYGDKSMSFRGERGSSFPLLPSWSVILTHWFREWNTLTHYEACDRTVIELRFHRKTQGWKIQNICHCYPECSLYTAACLFVEIICNNH